MEKFITLNIFKSYVLALVIVAAAILSAPQYLSYAQTTSEQLSSHTISLKKRFLNSQYVSDVMADNILLNLAYLNNEEINPKNIDWPKIRGSKRIEFTLKSGEVFAYHNDALPEYQQFVKTTNANFNASQGFKSDGYLYGDGVCHLASILYWVAKDAGLETYAPQNHNFAVIPEVPKEYGVSIYFNPGSKDLNSKRNLYIKNTLDKPVTFSFIVEGDNLEVKAQKSL